VTAPASHCIMVFGLGCVWRVGICAASTAVEKAAVKFFHGKALDALEAYSKEAEELLSAAVRLQVQGYMTFVVYSRLQPVCLLRSHAGSVQVKLDPSRVDAWNSLGNCFWKKKDLKAAKNCFEGCQVRMLCALVLWSACGSSRAWSHVCGADQERRIAPSIVHAHSSDGRHTKGEARKHQGTRQSRRFVYLSSSKLCCTPPHRPVSG